MAKRRILFVLVLFVTVLAVPAAFTDVNCVSADGGDGDASMNLSVNIQNYVPQVFGDSSGFTGSPPREAFTVEYWDIPKSALMQWGQGSDGTLLENVEATSLDGLVTILIVAGTRVLDADGDPLSQILVTLLYPSIEESTLELPSNPPDGYVMVAAFDFEPDGTQFIGSGIQIILTYDPENISEGDVPVIAFYNEEAGSWEFISGIPGPGENEITFTTDHFTIYSIFVERSDYTPPVLPDVITSSTFSIWWIILAGVLGIPFFWGINLLWMYIENRKTGVRF